MNIESKEESLKDSDLGSRLEDLPVPEDNASEVKGGMIKLDIVNRVVD